MERNELRRLQKETEIIDDGWHYSFHWDKDSGGTITVKGLEQAMEDCRNQRAYAEARAKKLNELLFKLSKAYESMKNEE